MGKIFTLSDDIISIAMDSFDDLLDQLGKPCRLVYPPRMIPCPNCIPDPIGRKSSNRWRNGGPVPFPMGGICPLCNGTATRATETSDTIIMLLETNHKNFYDTKVSVNLPDGTIQSKGYMSDVQKVQRADYMIANTNLENIYPYKYKIHGEIISPGNIVKDRYFVSLWQRIG